MKISNGITYDELALDNSVDKFLRKYRDEVNEFFTNEKIVKALDKNNFKTVFFQWRRKWNNTDLVFHLRPGVYIDSILSEILISSDIDFLHHISDVNEMIFSGNNSLKSITIPENIKSIASSAFNRCEFLTSVVMEEGIETIDNHAFSGCKSLISIIIPNSVISIGIGVFYGCDKLKEINYLGTKDEWEQIKKWWGWHNNPITINCKDGVVIEQYENK